MNMLFTHFHMNTNIAFLRMHASTTVKDEQIKSSVQNISDWPSLLNNTSLNSKHFALCNATLRHGLVYKFWSGHMYIRTCRHSNIDLFFRCFTNYLILLVVCWCIHSVAQSQVTFTLRCTALRCIALPYSIVEYIQVDLFHNHLSSVRTGRRNHRIKHVRAWLTKLYKINAYLFFSPIYYPRLLQDNSCLYGE